MHGAFGNAKLAGRNEVARTTSQDRRGKKQRIGF